MHILNFTDIQTSIVLFIVFLLLFLLTNLFFSLLTHKMHFAENQTNASIYSSIKQVQIVLFENIFVFHLFQWYVALLLWLFLYVGNYFLFRSMGWKNYVVKSLKSADSHIMKYQHSKKLPYENTKNNFDYEFNWIKAHTTSLSFFISPVLLFQFGLISVGNTPNNHFLFVVFEWAVLIGIASIIYWLTYFLCRSRILRYENWRQEHFKDFLIVCFFLLLFYVVSKIL